MKHRLLWSALAAVSGLAQAAEPLTVVIGSASPMSGAQASYGQDNANGVRMAIADLNRMHIVIGGRPVLWKVDAEDDQADPRQATTVAEKFVDEKVNAVVGHLNSGCTFPASRIYQRAGLPNITPSSTNPKIAKQGFDAFFRIIANDDALGTGLAGYASQQLKAKTVAVIDDRTAYGQGLADVFAAAATKDGMRVLARDYTNDKATDFSAILTRIKQLHPDVVFYGGMYSQAAPMLHQMQELGLKTRFMGGDGICAPDLARLAGSAADNTVCAEGGSTIDRMPGGKAWKQRYDASFGPNAYQIYSPYAYDATMVIAAAMRKAGSTDPRRYLSAIRTLDYDGVTKHHIHFTADGNLAQPTITLSRFEHGQKQVLAVETVQ